MPIDIGDYIVIAITCARENENEIGEANYLQRMNQNINQWRRLVVNIDGDLTDDLDQEFIFLLINQQHWARMAGRIIGAVNALHKEVIIYTHTGVHNRVNGIPCSDLNGFERRICIQFSHWTPYGFPFKDFLVTIAGGGEFRAALRTLIEKSLNKQPTPHLIALSILCQGYLAAHWDNVKDIDKLLPGWSGLSADIKNKPKGKWDSVKEDWWKPALGELLNELQTVTGDKDKIEELITAINGIDNKLETDKIQEFTGKVRDAYRQLKDTLSQR